MPVSPAVGDLLASSSLVPASAPGAGVMTERECPSCGGQTSSSTTQLTTLCVVVFTCLKCKYSWDEVQERVAKSAAKSVAKSAVRHESLLHTSAHTSAPTSAPRLVHTPAIETLEEKQRVLTQFETVMFHYSTLRLS